MTAKGAEASATSNAGGFTPLHPTRHLGVELQSNGRKRMSEMKRFAIIGLFMIPWVGNAMGDVIITLIPVDSEGQALSQPPVGEAVEVELWLSLTDDETPITALRQVQFDFRETDTLIDILGFEWAMEETGINDDVFYYKEADRIVAARANYSSTRPTPGFIVRLNQEPVRVARMTVLAHDAATLDVLGQATSDPTLSDEGARFLDGFQSIRLFRAAQGNVVGGQLAFAGGGGGNDNTGGENDNDGGSANDNQGDGDTGQENDNGDGDTGQENDNGDGDTGQGNDNGDGDTGSEVGRDVGDMVVGNFCGLGMMSPMLFAFLTLLGQRLGRSYLRDRRSR